MLHTAERAANKLYMLAHNNMKPLQGPMQGPVMHPNMCSIRLDVSDLCHHAFTPLHYMYMVLTAVTRLHYRHYHVRHET